MNQNLNSDSENESLFFFMENAVQPARTRREIEDEARRRHILNAAEKLFAERGLIDTSVSDIAKEAEFGIGTLYKYFKDKNTLIQSLIDNRLGAHFDEVEAVLEMEDTPAVIVDRLIDCQLDSLHKRRLFFKIYLTHFHPGTVDGYAGYTGALDHAVMQERKMAMLDRMDRVFDRGIEMGIFAPIKSRFLSSALFGMFISFSFLNGRNKPPVWDVDEMKIAMKRILFNRVLLITNENNGNLET